MSYAIMRIEKRNAANIGGMFCHNERKTEKHSNEDIDKDLSYLNYQLIKCDSYKNKINKELTERYKVNKSIRKDAVLCAEVIFTSDRDFFDNLTGDEEKKFFEKSVEFLKENFGEKNVVFATVHKDEKTPHLHAGIIPITDDGRLSYKSFVSSKMDLIKLQDRYFEKMSEIFPQLERGKSASESKTKHLKLDEYKLETKKLQLQEEEKNLELKSKELSEKKSKLVNENERLTSLDVINSNIKISKNILFKKTSVSMDYEDYKSLLKYARESEKNFNEAQKLKDINKDLEEDNFRKADSIRKLETTAMHNSRDIINMRLELNKYEEIGDTLKELGYENAEKECILYSSWKHGSRMERNNIIKNLQKKDIKDFNRAEKKIGMELGDKLGKSKGYGYER